MCYKIGTIDALQMPGVAGLCRSGEIIQVLYVHDLNKHMTAFII